MAFTVTKDTIIGDIMDADENTAPYFMEMGMHCLFCPASRGGTIFAAQPPFQGASGDFFLWRKALDKRLVTCAKLCTGDFVCDVGTDHGYLPCFMIKENMCKKALACDVAPMPLKSAEEHINREGLSDRIKTVLSDGLDNVPPEGITDVVMAGMGGELIARLLEKCPWVKNGVNLVLQPMTKWDVLRKWLYDNGFEVKKELACTEGQFAYSVMQAVYTGKTPSYDCDDRYLQFGFVKPEGEGKEYIARQAKRIFVAGSGMMKSEDKKELGERLVKLAQSELDRL